ncbi:MAG: hypothetical protein IJX27_07325 [Clostridia bacterium]|nr:hypothetical protein [Clostridia bacterium]
MISSIFLFVGAGGSPAAEDVPVCDKSELCEADVALLAEVPKVSKAEFDVLTELFEAPPFPAH